MKTSHKILLLLEVTLCFSPPVLMLATGLFLLPFQVTFWAQDPNLWQGPVMVIAMVAAGFIGLVTLLFVLSHLLRPNGVIRRPGWVLSGVLVGAAPLVPYVFAAELALIALLPLLCTLHIVYLARDMLLRPAFRRICGPLALTATVLAISGAVHAGASGS
ncbi:MAG: hypothetical protein ABW110_25320 [Steroidobacteraceae bacterium]